MSETIFCPGAAKSQSGAAVAARYPQALIADCGKIHEVEEALDEHNGPFVLPIWNSHEGEVSKASFVWDSIRNEIIKVSDVWPKSINFWFVRRECEETVTGLIGSVVVAKTQCAAFLRKNEKELVACDLTTVAFNEYKNGAKWDGVLVAPGQGQEENYTVVDRCTANPNNFTSFMRFTPSRCFDFDEDGNSTLTGVSMPSLSESLSDVQRIFFDNLIDSCGHAAEIPKLIFVFDRQSEVGLLFDGAPLYHGDLLDASEIEESDITVIEKVGILESGYCEELNRLFTEEFNVMNTGDFISHEGVNTCLMGCPPLGLYTHGFKLDVVSSVFKYYVSKIFESYYRGKMQGDELQQKFFARNIQSWLDKGEDGFVFVNIPAD